MKKKTLLFLLIVMSLQMNAQYKQKPDYHRLVTLKVINKNLYPVLDSILNFKTKAENINPGTFFRIEFDTDSLKPDLIVIDAKGPSLYGVERKFIGVFNYKERIFIVSAYSLDTTIFKKNEKFRTIDFSFKAIVGHKKDGTPLYNLRTFREVWCTWTCRYKDKKFKLLSFYSSDKKDSWFDHIEEEYRLSNGNN
jgi:hypothetical protein